MLAVNLVYQIAASVAQLANCIMPDAYSRNSLWFPVGWA